MSKDKKTEDNWDDLKSRLPGYKHQPPPDGYYESFPDRMVAAWKEDAQKKHQRRITLRKWIAVAAISIGVMVGAWWWMQNGISGSPGSYSSAEAYQYVIENIDEFSSLMETQITNTIQEEIQLPEDSAVEEYLLDELEGHDLEQIF